MDEEEERRRREEEKKERKAERAKRSRVDRYEDRTGQDDGDGESEEDKPEIVDAFKRPANAMQMWTDQVPVWQKKVWGFK